jgi:hypothetical protein
MDRAIWTIAVFVVFTATPALSQKFCDRPTAPPCIEKLGLPRGEILLQSCRAELDTFQRNVRTYTECLHQEQDAINEFLRKTIDHFNACVQKSSSC